MNKLTTPILSVIFLLYMGTAVTAGQEQREETGRPVTLDEIVNRAARRALERFGPQGFTEKNLAITLIEFDGRGRAASRASFRGDAPIYPASVVKLFYLVAAHRWLEDGRLKRTAELDRALRDMIVESSNDATHYVVDRLTKTTAGPELSAVEMRRWAMRRNAVNRYFASLGYREINVNQKTWCEGPYGRERVFVGEKRENRNRLTTEATARLLEEIVTGRAVTAARSAEMMKLLKRDPSVPSTDPDDQARGFSALGLEAAGARLWSKAGWTSTTRHDAAYVELPDGRRFILVTFTTDFSQEREIIPTVVRAVVAGLGERRP